MRIQKLERDLAQYKSLLATTRQRADSPFVVASILADANLKLVRLPVPKIRFATWATFDVVENFILAWDKPKRISCPILPCSAFGPNIGKSIKPVASYRLFMWKGFADPLRMRPTCAPILPISGSTQEGQLPRTVGRTTFGVLSGGSAVFSAGNCAASRIAIFASRRSTRF